MKLKTKKKIGLVVIVGGLWIGVELFLLVVRWSVYQYQAVMSL